ncbi:MAG: hypothetical protein FWE55_05070 [Synergistaceae bacterium]|nr:hypothetical protein [Synergistaceae bacterium]
MAAKVTGTINYVLSGVNRDTDELQITETSVKTKADWVDYEKYRDKEISAPFPEARF